MAYNPFSLINKTILVTGASSGIGAATAIMCSKLGANVIITGRNEERLLSVFNELEGIHNKSIIADLTSENAIESLVDVCPQLDGVVHSAGIGDRTLLKMVRQKNLDRVMAANFNAPVLLQRALLKKKLLKDKSSIVFIASRAPFAPAVGNGIYAASKGALIAYSKVLALELADKLIRVNCICPAMVWTDLVKKDAELTGADYSVKEKEYPLKRFGLPDDVAALAIYLLSDASSWMTGSIVDLTGGGELTLK